jgi:5-methylcytosine-specific restriction endonuclease McrA
MKNNDNQSKQFEIPMEVTNETIRDYGIRDKYAAEHPFCEHCYERGVLVSTEEMHHKKPLGEGGTHDRSNLIALCKSCHSQIHAKRGDRWGIHEKGPREACFVGEGRATK